MNYEFIFEVWLIRNVSITEQWILVAENRRVRLTDIL